MTTEKTPATPEQLKAKQSALACVREEQSKLGPTIPSLKAAVRKASEVLDQAKLAGIVAKGTPGFEDDIAAERSAKKAQTLLDQACLALDGAEDRIEFLDRAEKQLVAEVGKLQGEIHLAHMERSKDELRKRIAANAPAFAEMVREIAALRLLENQSTWPEELAWALEQSTPNTSMRGIVKEGQDRADRIRAGATVAEVSP